jgi:hypothetical protein
MSKNEWRPCPFCGKVPDNINNIFFTELESGGMAWHHFCNSTKDSYTGAVTIYGETMEEIKERWNTDQGAGNE